MVFNVEDEFTAEPLESMAPKTRMSGGGSEDRSNFIGFTFTAGTSLQRYEEEEMS